MLSVKEVLSLVEENGCEYGWDDPRFIKILCKQHSNLSMRDIDNYCPDDMFPMILEHSNYVKRISIDERPKREIVIQLVRDLLEKKPNIVTTLTQNALSWIVHYRIRFRNVIVYHSTLESLHGFGRLLMVEGNDIETFMFGLDFKIILMCFVSYLEHPNCRVKELTNGGGEVDMVGMDVLRNTRRFRNTLIRRVVLSPWHPNSVFLPYQVGEYEFDTMLHVLHKLHESLPVDLWRVIFYFL